MKKPQLGVTLIELMVAIVIGSMIALSVFSVLSSFEGRKRSLTSVNDINQAGGYAISVLDTWVRSAGSGFTQASTYAFGCPLKAVKSSTTLLPAASLPAPFASVNTGTAGLLRLAPVLIAPGQTTPGVSGASSDVLILMAGAAGKSESVNLLTAAPASTALSLSNTLAFGASDIVLVADQQTLSTGAQSPCFVEQVDSTFTESAGTSLPLNGSYYASTIDSKALSSLGFDAVVLNIGNIGKSSPPSFNLIGVGDNNTLFAYDLLQTSGKTTSQAIADGVFELHALYGVDDNEDGKIDSWVKPAVSSGDYTLSSLMAGTPEAAQKLARIRALRIGLILRTSLQEKAAVASSPLKLFSGIASGAQEFSRTLTGDELKYRYRTVELTVPLRNALLN
jgi:type IV pilus assembly protein PilW